MSLFVIVCQNLEKNYNTLLILIKITKKILKFFFLKLNKNKPFFLKLNFHKFPLGFDLKADGFRKFKIKQKYSKTKKFSNRAY